LESAQVQLPPPLSLPSAPSHGPRGAAPSPMELYSTGVLPLPGDGVAFYSSGGSSSSSSGPPGGRALLVSGAALGALVLCLLAATAWVLRRRRLARLQEQRKMEWKAAAVAAGDDGGLVMLSSPLGAGRRPGTAPAGAAADSALSPRAGTSSWIASGVVIGARELAGLAHAAPGGDGGAGDSSGSEDEAGEGLWEGASQESLALQLSLGPRAAAPAPVPGATPSASSAVAAAPAAAARGGAGGAGREDTPAEGGLARRAPDGGARASDPHGGAIVASDDNPGGAPQERGQQRRTRRAPRHGTTAAPDALAAAASAAVAAAQAHTDAHVASAAAAAGVGAVQAYAGHANPWDWVHGPSRAPTAPVAASTAAPLPLAVPRASPTGRPATFSSVLLDTRSAGAAIAVASPPSPRVPDLVTLSSQFEGLLQQHRALSVSPRLRPADAPSGSPVPSPPAPGPAAGPSLRHTAPVAALGWARVGVAAPAPAFSLSAPQPLPPSRAARAAPGPAAAGPLAFPGSEWWWEVEEALQGGMAGSEAGHAYPASSPVPPAWPAAARGGAPGGSGVKMAGSRGAATPQGKARRVKSTGRPPPAAKPARCSPSPTRYGQGGAVRQRASPSPTRYNLHGAVVGRGSGGGGAIRGVVAGGGAAATLLASPGGGGARGRARAADVEEAVGLGRIFSPAKQRQSAVGLTYQYY
jgi:hypothetical protein